MTPPIYTTLRMGHTWCGRVAVHRCHIWTYSDGMDGAIGYQCFGSQDGLTGAMEEIGILRGAAGQGRSLLTELRELVARGDEPQPRFGNALTMIDEWLAQPNPTFSEVVDLTGQVADPSLNAEDFDAVVAWLEGTAPLPVMSKATIRDFVDELARRAEANLAGVEVVLRYEVQSFNGMIIWRRFDDEESARRHLARLNIPKALRPDRLVKITQHHRETVEVIG